MTDNFFDHLPDCELITGTRAAAKPKFEFPCEHCGGTGKVQKTYGYSWATRRTYENTCKVCKGKGGFVTDRATRERNRANAEARAVRKQEANAACFDQQHPGLREFLAGASWSPFAQSLNDAITKYGNLSEKQLAAALSMKAKCDARQAEQATAADARAVDVDASRIRELFDTALANGKNRRALLAGGEVGTLRLTPASSRSKDPQAIWVKADGEFVGGIKSDGKFRPRRDCPDWVAEVIARVARDPKGEARLYGQRTGVCCCCGRELTDPTSIDAGIGPICAANWGL